MRCTVRKGLRLLALATLFLAGVALQEAKADTALLSFSGGGLVTSSSDQLFGWQFNVLSAVNVTALGVGDNEAPGLAVSHDVGIFRVSDQSLLTFTTVPAGTPGTLDNGFRYITLGSAVSLSPDTYEIVMTMPSFNADIQSIANTSVTTAPQIQYVTSVFDSGSTLAFPNPASNGSYAQGIFGPDFQFTPAAVPEPGTLALLASFGLTGTAFLARRRKTRA